MSHRVRTPARRAFFAMAAAAVLVAGCGESPLTPAALTVPEGPPVLVVAADGSAEYRQADSLVNETVAYRALSVTKTIEGSRGGWVQCGRYLLAIPQDAFDGEGTITMSMRDSTAMVVDLEIVPSSLNQFKVPVMLAVKTTGVDAAADSLSIYWYDPKGEWVDMNSDKNLDRTKDCLLNLSSGPGSGPDVDSSDLGLTAQLSHFSKYSTGKAGW